MHIGSDHLIDVFHLSHPHRLISNRRMSHKPSKNLNFVPWPDDQDLDGVAEAVEQTLISLYQSCKKAEHILTKLTHNLGGLLGKMRKVSAKEDALLVQLAKKSPLMQS